MGTAIVFPKIGFAMDEGTLMQWLVADGETVEAGAPLYTLESDKSVMEIEAPASGTLRIGAEPGTLCQVGTVIGEIE